MEDTICAISTAPGIGGIGIVRMSGKDAIEIAKKMYKGKKNKDLSNVKSHTMSYGFIVDPATNEMIDEVLVSVMRAPRTYTGEDIVEINCHGGIIVVKRILESCLRAGARLADAGEFTKRAFLNGKMDLAQSEAVIDLINSKTDVGAEKAFEQLEGKLSKKIGGFKHKILSLIAHIEASIDFTEYDDIEEVAIEQLRENLNELLGDIQSLLENANRGRIIREGLSTVIIGKPNVGKSSLLNSLLRETKAIVTEIPGTTRDIIEDYITIGGIPLKIVDTAGIRETEDVVEKIGVEKSKEAINKADLVIFLLDNSEELTDNDIKIANNIKDKNVIIVINKIDLESRLDENKVKELLPGKDIIRISVKEDISLEDLENKIKDMFFEGQVDIKNDTLITNVRHKDSIIKAKDSLKQAMDTLNAGMPIDMVSIDLKNALEHLGTVTGESVTEDVVGQIFAQFCVGK